MTDIYNLEVGNWTVNFLNKKRTFSKECEEESMKIIKKWQNSFPKENTHVQKKYGIPSLVIRFDCVINKGGNSNDLKLEEIEERPAGLGIALSINPEFQKRFANIVDSWPTEVIVLQSPLRNSIDDFFWARTVIGSNAEVKRKLVLVRAEPWEKDFWKFKNRSISTIRMKGMKLYGERMGLWYKVFHKDFEELPWSKGFVLKPIQGSKCIDICIWPPNELKNNKNKKGISSRKKIKETLLKYGTMYCQRFIKPMDSGLADFNKMIYRVYFGYNIDSKTWEFLGGLWNARSNWLIHGASDAVFGPVVRENKEY